jgi:hypothetical protein
MRQVMTNLTDRQTVMSGNFIFNYEVKRKTKISHKELSSSYQEIIISIETR